MISTLLLRVSVVGLIGMTLGLVMGIRQDFTLAPAHAHLNHVGFVVPFLAGLYYRAVPSAGASVLARYHAWIAVLGAIVFPIGIVVVLLSGSSVLVASGGIIVLLGATLFAVIVFRTTRPSAAAIHSAVGTERTVVPPVR